MRKIITPDEAKELLVRNTQNRKVNRSLVEFLKLQIKTGAFVYNGQSVTLAEDGTLIDGQHRLIACVETNISIDIEFISGVSSAAFGTIDTGRVRSIGDIFAINGVENSTSIAAICNMTMIKMGLNKKVKNTVTVKNSPDEVLEFFRENEAVITKYYSVLTSARRKQRLLTIAKVVAMALILDIEDNRGGLDYIRQILTGVAETESNVPILIREKLIRDALSPRTSLDQPYIRNMIFNSFSLYKENREVKRLVPRYGNAPKKGKLGI